MGDDCFSVVKCNALCGVGAYEEVQRSLKSGEGIQVVVRSSDVYIEAQGAFE